MKEVRGRSNSFKEKDNNKSKAKKSKKDESPSKGGKS